MGRDSFVFPPPLPCVGLSNPMRARTGHETQGGRKSDAPFLTGRKRQTRRSGRAGALGALENQASAVLLNSRIAANSAFSSLVRSRSWGRIPPCQALRDTCALPSGVLGPVDFSHGFHCLINSACRRRRSNVQPLAMFRLQ